MVASLDKTEILEAIQKQSPVFRKVNEQMYRIRCPICGDSQKNAQDSHCYIKCSYDPSEPLLYICFLCNSKGQVNKFFLDKLGIKNINPITNNNYNRINYYHKSGKNFELGNIDINSKQVQYIEHRLGEGFEYQDIEKFKIVWTMEPVKKYLRRCSITSNTLPSIQDSISFMSDDRSYILSRNFRDDVRWRKIPVVREPSVRSFYTIATSIDIFSKDLVYVNIAEGIFDILSAYKNFNTGNNSAYIAVLGSDYISGIDYAISKGLMGSNIIVNIYLDSDIDMKEEKIKLKKYKFLYNKITLYQNVLSKDIGVPMNQIKLTESTI
jgi:hypothetical protein